MKHKANLWRNKLVVALFLVAILAMAAPALGQTLRVELQDFREPEPRAIIEDVLIPKFEAMHPGVKVEVSFTDWTNYIEKYVTYYLGGVLPDVLNVGSAALGQFADQGLIRPLNEYVNNWDAKEDFIPAALEDGKIGDTYWAITNRYDVKTLGYNMDMFDLAGLDRHAPPTSWDELAVYARRLTQHDADGNIYVQGFDVRPNKDHVLPFVYQAGGRFMSPDGSETLLASDEAIEAVEFLHSLIWEHGASLPTAHSLVQGRVAMLYEGSWIMQDVYKERFDLGIAEPLVHREQATHAYSNRLAIASTSQHPDLAWAFIDFLLEPEHMSLIVSESKSFPPRISTLQLPPFSDDARWMAWLTAAMVSQPQPGYITELPEVISKYNAALSDIFNNKAPARTRLVEFARDVNENVLPVK